MNRPAMRALLTFIDTHPHQKFVVVFDDLSRFARDVEFHLKLRAAFKVRDVLLRCLNFNLDDSPEGMFAETVVAASNELERHKNRRQVVQKQKARLEAGYWAFARKRGYTMVKDPVHGTLGVPNKQGKELIKPALEAFAKGDLVRKIDVARYFVDKGLWESPRSPEKYLSDVSTILADPYYAGYIEYLPWEVSRRKGHHQPLISSDVYDLIQKRLMRHESKARVRMDIRDDFPLRGLLVCAECGGHLTSGWSKGRPKTYAYYYCYNRACSLLKKTLRKEDVEVDFETLLKRNALKKNVEKVIELVCERIWKQETEALARQEWVIEGRRKALGDKIKSFSEVARKTPSDGVRKAYEEQIEECVRELEALAPKTKKEDMAVHYRTALAKAKGLLKSPYSVWKNSDVIEKHRLFFFLFEAKLPYFKKEGYRTGDSLSTTRLFEELATTSSDDVGISRYRRNRAQDAPPHRQTHWPHARGFITTML